MERLYRETRHGRISFMFRPGQRYLVLLHGLGGLGNNFMKLAGCINSYYGLVFPDLLGHGKSDSPEDITIKTQSEAVEDLINELGIKEFYIGGNSYGGWVSLEHESEFKNSLGIILISSAGTNLTVGDFGDESVDSFLARVMNMNPSNRKDVIRKILLRNSGEAFRITSEMLASIDKPALIIWGSRDSMIDINHGKFMNEHLINSRFVVIEGGGHTPHSSHPKEVCASISDFLDGKTIG